MDLSRQQRLIIFIVVGALLAGVVILGIRSSSRTDHDIFIGEASEASEEAVSTEPVAKEEDWEEDKTLYVHVCGEVSRPGVYPLAPGARRFQALDAAGGATGNGDTAAINLAALINDGEQIYIPKKGQVKAGMVRENTNVKSAGGVHFPIDINRATEAELVAVPGIGPSMAASIIAFRKECGRFSSVEQLTEVSGIGDKKLQRFRSYLCVR